mmetsp:Transcript_35914/g.86781  ORF Transcript_35914/g.86781 Transcript_35914/m.86781 type:complete len:81 (-) Transcript_35914:978-1220(-)
MIGVLVVPKNLLGVKKQKNQSIHQEWVPVVSKEAERLISKPASDHLTSADFSSGYQKGDVNRKSSGSRFEYFDCLVFCER